MPKNKKSSAEQKNFAAAEIDVYKRQTILQSASGLYNNVIIPLKSISVYIKIVYLSDFFKSYADNFILCVYIRGTPINVRSTGIIIVQSGIFDIIQIFNNGVSLCPVCVPVSYTHLQMFKWDAEQL